MKQIQAVLPLLLIIVVLIGALILIRPGGPLMPGNTDHSDTTPPPNGDGDQTDDPSADSGDTTPETPDGNEPETPPADDYQYSYDISPYLPAISTSFASKKDILLVNKQHPLGQLYTPSQLVFLHTSDTNGKSIQLDSTAAAALKAMLLCMRADGITDTFVTSAYRSYQYQVALQNNYLNEELSRNPSLSKEEALAIVHTYSAAPGSSEHQSGLCVDFMTTSMNKLVNEQFEPTAAFRWLQENACQFGFILRYPQDKSDITGYAYESWHYRFVGREAAIEITRRGITLEEYLAEQ